MRVTIDLPLAVDRECPVPLAVQVADQLREAMRTGRLRAGERLPSTRALAALLRVSRTVATDAYQQLYAEGWLDGRHGSGTYVADEALPYEKPAEKPAAEKPAERSAEKSAEARRAERREPPPPGVVDLRAGRPWVFGYDTAAWRRAWRSAGELALNAFPDPYGHPELRELLADHLRRARAVPVGAGNVMVTRGTGNGLDLIAATLLGPGTRAGVEEPGWRAARRIFASRGAEVVPCPVDEQGVIVEALPDDLRVLYTTPAHQFPLGGRLPIPRRRSCSPGRAGPARSSSRTTTTPSSATTSRRCPRSTGSTPGGWCCSARCRSRSVPTSGSAGWSPPPACSTPWPSAGRSSPTARRGRSSGP